MACITRIKGTGVANCTTGASNNIQYDLTYPERWTLGQSPDCASGVLAPISPAGEIHPNHRFSAIESITYEGCDAIPANQKFDCLNGGCIPKTTHNTPGKYASLTACQSGCAKDSNCTGECVSVAELAALQQAASNLQSKFCK